MTFFYLTLFLSLETCVIMIIFIYGWSDICGSKEVTAQERLIQTKKSGQRWFEQTLSLLQSIVHKNRQKSFRSKIHVDRNKEISCCTSPPPFATKSHWVDNPEHRKNLDPPNTPTQPEDVKNYEAKKYFANKATLFCPHIFYNFFIKGEPLIKSWILFIKWKSKFEISELSRSWKSA